MNIAKLIYQEARKLPETEAREVLDFVEFLQTRRVHRETDGEAARRKAALLACFSRFRIDMAGFRFDREDANVRR